MGRVGHGRLLASSVALLVGACSGPGAAPEPEADDVSPPDVAAAAEHGAAIAAEVAAVDDVPPEATPSRAGARSGGVPTGGGEDDALSREMDGEPEAQAPRDLDAELAERFGSSPECATEALAAAHPGAHVLNVAVRVSASGAVSAASVTARGIPPASLACLRRHAEAIRFDAPVEGAPRTVRASFPLDLTPRRAASGEPDLVLPPGARAPGVVLPAQVGEGLPPGAVPPQRTLPARGDGTSEGRPKGFVEPSRTLPARGQSGRSRIITGGE